MPRQVRTPHDFRRNHRCHLPPPNRREFATRPHRHHLHRDEIPVNLRRIREILKTDNLPEVHGIERTHPDIDEVRQILETLQILLRNKLDPGQLVFRCAECQLQRIRPELRLTRCV